MSHFGLIDWLIVACYIAGIMYAGVSMRRHVGKLEHFMVAGQQVDVFLGIASLSATEFGIVTAMYTAELGYKDGFSGATPGILVALAMLCVGLTGFVIKPLRNSGSITIPEMLDRRFGGRVRLLAAVVIVLGGLLNMGIFLRVGGEFLMIVTGIGADHMRLVMTGLLLMVLIYTTVGGMVSVLVADYLQFLMVGSGLVLVTLMVAHNAGWSRIAAAVAHKDGPGGFNPFLNPNMGVTYVAWQALTAFAIVLTWQTMIQRVLAAKDSRTARKIYTRTSFYFVGRFVLPGLWGMGALAVLAAGRLPSSSLHAMPEYLAALVPSGVLGLVVASMLAAEMSTDSGYMLTWSTVIFNDILAPLRRNPFSARMGLRMNRLILVAIGIFLLIYGLWYRIPGRAYDYLAITGNIYLSSISVLLISCCYWKRANRYGAMCAIVGGALSPIFFLISGAVTSVQVAGLASFGLAAFGMIAGSLLTRKEA